MALWVLVWFSAGFPDGVVCGGSLFARGMLLVVVGCVWMFAISFGWFSVVVAFVWVSWLVFGDVGIDVVYGWGGCGWLAFVVVLDFWIYDLLCAFCVGLCYIGWAYGYVRCGGLASMGVGGFRLL